MDDLEERFITEYHYNGTETETPKGDQLKAASNSTIEENNKSVPPETISIEEEEIEEETIYCNAEEATEGNDFQSFDIPLFDKNAWDDTALIEAWDLAINQRDNPSATDGVVVSGSTNQQPNYKPNKSSNADLTSGRNPTTKVPKILANNQRNAISKKKLKRLQKKESRNNLDKCSIQNSIQAPHSIHDFPPAATNINTYSQTIHSTEQMPQNGNGFNRTSISNQPLVPPASMLPVVQGQRDEDLDNLLMAWYFTGYYTALYQKSRK